MTPGLSPADLLVPALPGQSPRVKALQTLRHGGVSAAPYGDGQGGGGLNLGTHVGDDPAQVAANRALLRAMLSAEPLWLSQVHGSRVVHAADAAEGCEADAVIADRPGLVCAIMTADCLPVLFADDAGRVVGAAHGGWRGLAGGVLENTVAAMRAAGARQISAWLGPAIGPRRFEVGAEVREAFLRRDAAAAAAFVESEGGPEKYLADIYALARLALAAQGINAVSGGGFCTVEEARRFYSYRRDRVTGRMASLIWIEPQA